VTAAAFAGLLEPRPPRAIPWNADAGALVMVAWSVGEVIDLFRGGGGLDG
jgi:hypothetical protein